jgi:ribonuclease VapC
MIIDTSALVSLLRNEPDSAKIADAIEQAETRKISAASLVELSVVFIRLKHPNPNSRIDRLIEEAEIAIEPLTERHARLARDAFAEFGKGSSHPAKLNFGDCFAYALAKDTREPLLFVGDDFRHTDIEPALD